MRPQRFQDFLVRLASEDLGAGQAKTLKDAGDTKRPCGLAATLGGREARFQIVGKFEQTETPVEGEPFTLDGPRAEGPEGWLAGLLAASGSREIAGIDQWSLRENPKDLRDGLTVAFHSGAEVYVRLL